MSQITLESRKLELQPEFFREPNPLCLDLTKGQRWMQKELIFRQGYTNMDLDRTRRPHVIGDFRKAPFCSEQFMLILFDPPWLTDKRVKGLVEKYVSKSFANPIWKNYDIYKSKTEMKESVMWGFMEISRLLRSGGLCIFKWGSGSGVGIEKILSYRPLSLEVKEIRKRKSKGGKFQVTWHTVLQKR